jgi:RHS repeat-associated protein
LVERYDYQDFGEPSIFDSQGRPIQTSSVRNPYLFTGQRYDPETGLYYYRTRYLDPRVGRFTTRDTIGIWEDAGNLGNGYTYAHNNPQTFVDPKGESVYRWYACSSPWPGPRQVMIEYEGCSKIVRTGMYSPVCRAFRASGQAKRDVFMLWMVDFSGIPLTGIDVETTRQRLQKWFGGPDNATSTNSKGIIGTYLAYVFNAFKENDVDIDCEGNCDTGNAYVVYGGYDVNLCNSFFSSGFSGDMQSAILIHELTHAYADTDDYFYYPTDGSNFPWNMLYETPTLRENADTYEQFVLQYYL